MLRHLRFMRFILTLTCLAAVMIAPTVHAQELSPDFASNVQPTLPANELLVGQLHDALDLTPTEPSDSIATAEDLERQLSIALAMAPDDAARSRLDGVHTHTVAALDALRLVDDQSSLDVARSRLEQARAEAQEGLDELRPFILNMVVTGELTGK
jgi:hypothetical protein